jgi:hypothetical protein
MFPLCYLSNLSTGRGPYTIIPTTKLLEAGIETPRERADHVAMALLALTGEDAPLSYPRNEYLW